MALQMPKLTRDPKSGDWVARKVIPADTKAEYQRAFGVRSEALFKVDGGLSQGEAKRLYGDWIGEVESRIETLRSARKGLGRTLSQKEAIALAGEWYRWFVTPLEENPGNPESWQEEFEAFVDELRTIEPAWAESVSKPDDDFAWRKAAEFRPEIRPMVYRAAQAERFLTSKGILLQPKAMDLFLDALEGVMVDAFLLLKRRAEGDYSADMNLKSFPSYEPKREAGLNVWELWEAWIAEKQPAAQTRDRWRAVFLDLKDTFEGRDANSITEDEARKWVSGLTTAKRSAKTVSEVWLNAARTIFSWAKGNKRLDENAFADVKVTIPRQIRNRETKAFTNKEAQTILRGALEMPPPRLSPHYVAARRWVPWLCAYSGARAGEITQLRGVDVFEQDGVWALRLTPEAGTIKSGTARVVPLHEHLIDQGFLAFVKSAGKGPLFYNPEGRRKASKDDPTNPGQSQARKTANHIGEWVRSLGIDDPEIRPNHAWRHTFKQIADRCGISERASDAITGHSPQTEGRKYGQPPLEDMAEALKRFPRYSVSTDA